MAIKINANMSNDKKQMLVNWIPRLLKCFSAFNCKMNVSEAYIGRTFVQFTVEDLNKTRFNEFMLDKLTDSLNAEFEVKNTDVYPDADNPDYALGIQIPLKNREFVSFSSITASKEYLDSNRYTFVVGESVKDKSVCCNLLSDKRVLLGGMTNAGKTVFLNSMICSLILKNNADTLKFVLMDKDSVFKNYAELPHLLFHGVVFDDYGAKEVFDWLKSELDWRKMLFNRNGCRNLDEYNRYAQVAKEDSFPAILVVIDELTDWISTDEFLKMLFEILQVKATAELGIFFIVATQKPTVDYLGASLKEMFPTKIIFKCDLPINSRILFGKTSAVKLLGEGDLFYRKSDSNKISRLQAPFVTQEDIKDTLARFNIRLD
ncbi:MAG TPA: FtsK/SpoIIIE domain-containing protein [Clostridia bacterium]|nr:FtsK/SpoIIIE domain-containing protein [Clostridia bacterium]